MSTFTCPYCRSTIPEITAHTVNRRYPSFHKDHATTTNGWDKTTVCLTFYYCPECKQHTILAHGTGSDVKDIDCILRPKSLAIKFPDYVPQAVREDYEEACSIVHLSPKASATLSRRCLQGMIHDFWGINSKNLNQEINELKTLIDTELWNAVDAVRKIGNIGAHMEKDVSLIIDIDTNEAQYLINLIELLIYEWYINRENRKQLISNVVSVNDSKQQERKRLE